MKFRVFLIKAGKNNNKQTPPIHQYFSETYTVLVNLRLRGVVFTADAVRVWSAPCMLSLHYQMSCCICNF